MLTFEGTFGRAHVSSARRNCRHMWLPRTRVDSRRRASIVDRRHESTSWSTTRDVARRQPAPIPGGTVTSIRHRLSRGASQGPRGRPELIPTGSHTQQHRRRLLEEANPRVGEMGHLSAVDDTVVGRPAHLRRVDGMSAVPRGQAMRSGRCARDAPGMRPGCARGMRTRELCAAGVINVHAHGGHARAHRA